jgi:hypothetical protein
VVLVMELLAAVLALEAEFAGYKWELVAAEGE